METSMQNHLLPGEEILWEGRPKILSGINPGSVGKSAFGLMWLGFSLFWTITAFLMTRAIPGNDATAMFFKVFFPLFGLPFVAIGIFIVFINPMKQKNKVSNTLYYLTDKRLIITSNGLDAIFISIFIKDLKTVHLTKNKDNTGNIMFGSVFNDAAINGRGSDTYVMPAYNNCFYRIEDAEDVYKLILLHHEIESLNNV